MSGRGLKFLMLSVWLLLLVLSGPGGVFAASSARDSLMEEETDSASTSGNETFVYLLNADEIRFSKLINPDAQMLVGNVVFRHDSMYMYCDSALFFQASNSFNAYNNVRMEQGDTLAMYGDSLYYDGEARLARVRNNVRLENRSMVLLTDSLNYDRNLNLGYFFNGGTLLDSLNTLTSDYGQYNTTTEFATFMHDVELVSPDYVINTDTLNYNTAVHIAFITTPATIVSDENVINTDRAVFNTDSKDAVLMNRSVLTQNDDGRRMTGDSICYSDATGIMEGFGNVIVENFQDNANILGEYMFYDQNLDSAVVTGNALAIEYSTRDSLFIHADTFKVITRTDENDSVLFRQVRAYNRVKAYRFDMQMVCDSLVFDSSDSCLTLYRDPIVWSENQQILGEVIKAYMNDSTLDWAHVIGQALFVQQVDSACFNQIAGREMKAFFKDGNITKATVDGNVEVVYFPIDSDSLMIGMNTTQSSNLTAYFDLKEISSIVIHEKSSGVLYPMSQIPEEKRYLKSFSWFDHLRPFSQYDIFYWRGKQASEQLRTTPNRRVPLPTLNNR